LDGIPPHPDNGQIRTKNGIAAVIGAPGELEFKFVEILRTMNIFCEIFQNPIV
jgi:hypothetical protein